MNKKTLCLPEINIFVNTYLDSTWPTMTTNAYKKKLNVLFFFLISSEFEPINFKMT